MSTRDVLRANDARFYALAAGFSADEWSQPSLCDGWSNHDVLAHLVVGYRAGAGVVAAEMLRHGGSFDRANAALARSVATSRTPADLLDDFGRLTRGRAARRLIAAATARRPHHPRTRHPVRSRPRAYDTGGH